MAVWVGLIFETELVWAAGILVDSMKCCCFYSYSSLLHPFLGCTGARTLAGGSPHLLKMNFLSILCILGILYSWDIVFVG